MLYRSLSPLRPQRPDFKSYLGGIEVKNNKVEAIYTGVGRAFNTASSGQAYRYEYYLLDHLGNISLSFTDKNNDGLINNQGEILQENQYYPFGMGQHGSWYDDATVADNPYLYNDKELTTDFGLNLSDYGARGYDAAIGRWWQVDPLAEKMANWSPYAYGFNNPIRFIDPDGRFAIVPDDYYNRQTGKYLGSDGASTTNSRLISGEQYSAISQANGGSTNVAATSALQASSQVITINELQINTVIQGVRDNSRSSGLEHSAYITLNPETAVISAVKGPTGDNGETHLEYFPDGNTAFMVDGEKNQVTGTNIIVGQAHGHPLTNADGMVNEAGTSLKDKNASINSGISIYAVDSYSGKKAGGVGDIHRVTPNGTQTNFIGKTIGSGTTSNFNIGLDALQRTGGKIK